MQGRISDDTKITSLSEAVLELSKTAVFIVSKISCTLFIEFTKSGFTERRLILRANGMSILALKNNADCHNKQIIYGHDKSGTATTSSQVFTHWEPASDEKVQILATRDQLP